MPSRPAHMQTVTNRPAQQAQVNSQAAPDNRNYGSPSQSSDDTGQDMQTDELTPDQYIEILMGLDEDQLIEYYNQCYLNGQGNEAYAMIEQYRPEMLYIFESQA